MTVAHIVPGLLMQLRLPAPHGLASKAPSLLGGDPDHYVMIYVSSLLSGGWHVDVAVDLSVSEAELGAWPTGACSPSRPGGFARTRP
jgi:hypothetical protein